ncbi:MAG: hypothetical protein DRH37_02255 [Deltaproteobacteria bacterium]|nr:MAG: hypothetical protein DRH37_02255 [Deltaproteobacteria bacterium]
MPFRSCPDYCCGRSGDEIFSGQGKLPKCVIQSLTLKIILIVALIFISIVPAYLIWTYHLFKDKVTEKDLAYEDAYETYRREYPRLLICMLK